MSVFFLIFFDPAAFLLTKASKHRIRTPQNGLPKPNRTPAKPRADSRSAFPRTAHTAVLSRRAARRTDGQTQGKALRRQTGVPHPCGVLSARSMPLRCGQRLSENRPYTRRTAALHGASNRHAKNGAIERRSHLGKRKGLCRLSLRHTVITTSPRETPAAATVAGGAHKRRAAIRPESGSGRIA